MKAKIVGLLGVAAAAALGQGGAFASDAAAARAGPSPGRITGVGGVFFKRG